MISITTDSSSSKRVQLYLWSCQADSLQGEVESIAQMKAKAQNEHEDGLLEYLEDIIGTTKYKEPIEQASQEVETLNEARGEKMNRLRVVEREKAALEVSLCPRS